MSNITWKIKDSFFDRPKVQKAVDKAKRRHLSRAGAFVRRTARSSIKPAGKRARKRRRLGQRDRGLDPTISRPGRPPRLHTKGNRNLKKILFAYQSGPQSVVVGPVLFQSGGNNVPQLIEHGGRGRVKVRTSVRRGRKRRTIRTTTQVANFRPRPFMLPAMEKEAPKFPDLFRNSVK